MKQLKIQDYVSIGIYTAIYFFIVSIVLVILSFIIPGYSSIFIPSGTALCSGIIYLLLIKKIPRFGALTIMSSIMGVFFLITGHFPLSFLPHILCGALADLIQHRTSLPMKFRNYLGYTIFSLGLMGPVLPLWFMKQAYIHSLVARGKDSIYIDKVFASITSISLIASFSGTIICSILGLMIGQKIYQKHFNKEQKEDVPTIHHV